MSMPIDRRVFMKRAAGAGTALSISMAGPLTRKALGANDRVRVGVIGTGRQGVSNLKAFRSTARRSRPCATSTPPTSRRASSRRARTPRPTATSGSSSTTRRSTSSSTRPRPLARPAHGHGLPGGGRTSSSRSRSRSPWRRARRWSPRPASTSGSSRWASGSARTSTSSRRRRSSARASSARSPSCARGTTATPSRRASGTLRQGPARWARLGHVAGRPRRSRSTRTASAWARSLVHLPLLLRLRERHARRLGGAPRRHRPVGPRGSRAAGRHRHRLEVRHPGQRRHARHPRRHLRVPRLRLHLREPPRERQLDVWEGLRHRVPRHPGHDAPHCLGFEVSPEKRKREDGTEVGRTASMRMEAGGRRPLQPRRQHARLPEDAPASGVRHRVRATSRRRRACSGTSRCGRASASSSTRSSRS